MQTPTRFFHVALSIVCAHEGFVRLSAAEGLVVLVTDAVVLRCSDQLLCLQIRLADSGLRNLPLGVLMNHLSLRLSMLVSKWRFVVRPVDLRMNLPDRRRHIARELLLSVALVIVVLSSTSVANLRDFISLLSVIPCLQKIAFVLACLKLIINLVLKLGHVAWNFAVSHAGRHAS
jgi:hypothetical protein